MVNTSFFHHKGHKGHEVFFTTEVTENTERGIFPSLCVLCDLCGKKNFVAFVTFVVKKNLFSFFLFLFLFPLSLFATITVTTDITKAVENQPIEAQIKIVKQQTDTIDTHSFEIDGKPLQVETVQESLRSDEIPAGQNESIYRFQLPEKPVGLYLFPSITVKVNERTYQTISTTFQVQPSSGSTPYLRLETTITPTEAVYPGERLQLKYRIYYVGNIDLTLEKLPLLEPQGFQKVGEKDIKDSVENRTSIQEINQQVRAMEPGTYHFPSSVIEGSAYEEDSEGNHVYNNAKLHSETPKIDIVVLPFPVENKPPSFNGALGHFTFSARLASPSQTYVGDPLQVILEMSGDGEWATVTAPNIRCQPGFSGFFQVGDLMPEKLNNSTKQFTITLRPLLSFVKEIPPIQFSFFDPLTKKYKTLYSEAIPVTVVDLPKQEVEPTVAAPRTDTEAIKQPNPWRKQWEQPLSAVELHETPLNKGIPFSLPFNRLAELVLFGILLLCIQIWLKDYMERDKRMHQSLLLLKEASNKSLSLPERYHLLEKALLRRLWEMGWIGFNPDNAEELPQKEACGMIRDFLLRIDENRFSGEKEIPFQTLLSEGKKLFRIISTKTNLILLTFFLLFSELEGADIAKEQAELNGELEKQFAVLYEGKNRGETELKIGNSLFRLQEYPWAILYDYKSLSSYPNDPNILENLKRAQNKLGIVSDKNQINKISSQLLDILFLVTFFVGFMLFSLGIYFEKIALKRISWITFALSGIVIGVMLFDYYFSLIEGVMVKSTLVYTSPDKGAASYSQPPVLAGEKVKVIAIDKDGHWLKIISDNGKTTGFVPNSTIRLI